MIDDILIIWPAPVYIYMKSSDAQTAKHHLRQNFILHFHLVILQTLLSKAAYNLGR